MSSKNAPVIKASAVLPGTYRFLLMNVEPFLAVLGCITVILQSSTYVDGLIRETGYTLDARTEFIYTQLAGGWLHFAFTEAVVLRFVDDVRVWRLIAAGMLLSDIAFCHSCAQAVGGWREWFILSHWTVLDWSVFVTTWPFVLSRVAILLGIGFKKQVAVKAE